MIQSYPEVRSRFEKASSKSIQVVLLSPHMAEGTVVFHQHPDQSGGGGNFFPGRTKVSISEKTRCQLLLAKSRVLLNVTMFPSSETSTKEHFPFEIAAWEPLEQQSGK